MLSSWNKSLLVGEQFGLPYVVEFPLGPTYSIYSSCFKYFCPAFCFLKQNQFLLIAWILTACWIILRYALFCSLSTINFVVWLIQHPPWLEGRAFLDSFGGEFKQNTNRVISQVYKCFPTPCKPIQLQKFAILHLKQKTQFLLLFANT